MLVSLTSKKFLFVHVYKTAGMSLRAALVPHLLTPFQERVNRLNSFFGRGDRYDYSPLPKHSSARICRDHFGADEFAKYESFAVVRNPWDWQVSLYNYVLSHPQHHQFELISGFQSFDKYIRWRCEHEVRLQRDLICEPGTSQILVKRLMRFETLKDDFAEFCRSMDIAASLPHLNKSTSRPWREFYTEETRVLVAEAFKPDISLFGYSFEEN